MSCLTLNIFPDTDTIHTFSDDGTTLPNESYTISGTVEVNATRPIQIRQLSVQFQGIVDCVISTTDFFQEHSSTKFGDEIPLHKWNTIDPSELGFVDRMTRKALGQSNASLTIADERVDIFTEPQLLGIGKTSWPFILKINNVHLLPPSLFLPHHTIQYHLSARIKLNSLSERVKVSYWNARLNTLRLRRVSTSSEESASSSSTSSSALSRMTVQTPHIISEYNHLDQFNDVDSISSSSTVISKRNKRQLLGCSNPIQIYRHAYPSLYSLYSVPRIRYRGSREEHITYEIGMSKFTCLQKKNFSFSCSFKKICQDAVIESIEYYLEQTECYPIRAGDFNTFNNIYSEWMVPRQRKFSRTKHDMRDYQDGEEMNFNLQLDLPHISPQITTTILQITHKLRLIVKFKDSSKERNMSLSFPLTIGTVPKLRSSIDSQEQAQLPVGEVHVRQELDQWLLTPDDQYSMPFFDDYNKLPSYRDALREGNPPSPFLEDNY